MKPTDMKKNSRDNQNVISKLIILAAFLIVNLPVKVCAQIDSSAVQVSNLKVEMIINDPESMSVEAFAIEFDVVGYENLDSLRFEIYTTDFDQLEMIETDTLNNYDEPEIPAYQFSFPIIKNEESYFLVSGDIYNIIRYGNVKLLFECTPLSVGDKTSFSICGTDKIGLPIKPVNYNPF